MGHKLNLIIGGDRVARVKPKRKKGSNIASQLSFDKLSKNSKSVQAGAIFSIIENQKATPKNTISAVFLLCMLMCLLFISIQANT